MRLDVLVAGWGSHVLCNSERLYLEVNVELLLQDRRSMEACKGSDRKRRRLMIIEIALENTSLD